MKKEKRALLTLSALGFGLLLAGCGGTPADSTPASTSSDDHVCSVEQESHECSVEQESHECSVEPEIIEVPVEVEKKFGVTISAAEGTTVTIVDPQEDGYSAGSTLKFTVSVDKSHLELDYVKYDGKVLTPDGEGLYQTLVVNKEAAIETAVLVRGEENLLEVADVDQNGMPNTAAKFKAVLENAKAKEAKYASSATLESSYESYDEIRRAEAKIGHNDVVHVTGQKLNYSSAALYNYEGTEKGIQDGRYYLVDDDTSSVTFSRGATLKTIVSDETKTVLPSQIKESDAKLQASTSGFIDDLLSKTFTSKSYGFLPTDSYGWKEIRVSSELAEDGKSYFAKATAYYSTYDRIITFVAEVDGDGFLRSGHLTLNDYADDDLETFTEMYDADPDDDVGPVETTFHKPVDGAEPKEVKEFNVDFVRGYRSRLEKTDLSDNFTSDYDVLVDYTMPGESSSTEVTEGTVYNSATLSFRFRQHEFKPIFIVPTLIGAKEEGFVTWNADGKPVVSNIGDFTLQFDNGLGEIKEVPLNSIRPDAKSMTATLNNSKVYNGATAILTTEITPAGADQSVTVELKESSTCEVTIVDNGDGTFNVTGDTNGEGTLVVTSVANPSLTKEVNFTVEDKPDIDDIKAFLTSKTLHGFVSSWGSHFVNFNEDGTGKYVCYEGSKGDVIPFTWALDEEAITISIEVDGTKKSRYYNLGGFSEVSSSSVQLIYLYGSSPKYVTLTSLDEKLDLDTADVSSY